MQFLAKFSQIKGFPLWGWYPPSRKSWIRHCLRTKFFSISCSLWEIFAKSYFNTSFPLDTTLRRNLDQPLVRHLVKCMATATSYPVANPLPKEGSVRSDFCEAVSKFFSHYCQLVKFSQPLFTHFLVALYLVGASSYLGNPGSAHICRFHNSTVTRFVKTNQNHSHP